MTFNEDFFYRPRKYNTIELWKNVTPEQWNDAGWQRKNSIRSVDQLKRVVRLTDHQESEIRRTIGTLRQEGKEPLRITPYYASLMQEDPFNPVFFGEKSQKRLDPIFWQSVPTPANLMFPDAGVEGAMSEGSRSYGDVNSREVDRGLFYIGYNRNINEVLVTGGDALMISFRRLKYILGELSRIPHLRVIRIATRVPVVLPMLITDELLEMIRTASNRYSKGPEKNVYFMTHINHYQEVTADLAAAVKKITGHGFTIRNQTVLLNHVNDHYRTLAETFRRMFWIGVHPYYLLQCHKEKGWRQGASDAIRA